MVDLSLILKLSLENHGKFESCMKSKTINRYCKYVEIELEILSLIQWLRRYKKCNDKRW